MTVYHKPPTESDRCGTDSGYQVHQRAGEMACDKCLKARRDYIRRYRHSKGRPRVLTPMEEWHLTGKSGDFL